MFAKLALRNVKRQISSYLIYFVTVALSVALMFAVNELSYSSQVRTLAERSSDVGFMFRLVTVLSCLVTALVLSYAAGFMLRLRKREFGMYLTLGMTRGNIQTLFALETGAMFAFALVLGVVLGLVIYQLLMALLVSVLDIPFAISGYSLQGGILTIVVSGLLFAVSTLGSLRYLNKVTVTELLREEKVEKSEKRPGLWGLLSLLSLLGLAGSFALTYRDLMASFYKEGNILLMLWLVLDLVMVFLTHVTLCRSVTGLLLRSKKLKNRGTNALVLRGLSGKMTMNSLLIGALATLLVFAIAMSNVAFGEKVHADFSVQKECPYDVMAWFSVGGTQDISQEEGRKIIEKYSPITGEQDFQLRTTGEDSLCSRLEGWDLDLQDEYMSLSQFNSLMEGCGREPITLEGQFLLVTSIQGISTQDLTGASVVLEGREYTWAGSTDECPEFTRRFLYFVIPDEALENMDVAWNCVAYTLENSRPDAGSMLRELIYYQQTPDGPEENCDHRIQEEVRWYYKGTSGTLIIGTLYVSTVFVCLALAILALKILSTLNDERRRFSVLYRLGADARTQRTALLRQTGAFFLAPFILPMAMTLPFGFAFSKVYEVWGFAGLKAEAAFAVAGAIALVIAGIYLLYFALTYRMAKNYVIDE